ncbi:unnamed protein product [Clonostachys solani]|uniref:Glycine-rich domain-containing protein 1 n=1 Tax=Clonostachys solani TaxID=160281 RepID=A0A9N9ZJB3_9HYPO|nr:unnamed protein product [Clonostachys solani]
MPSKLTFHAPGPNVPDDNVSSLHHQSTVTTNAIYNKYISNTALAAPTPEEAPKIPAPHLFEFTNPKSFCSSISPDSSWNPPLTAECAAHLEFLETLFTTRSQVLNSKKISAAMGYSSLLKPTTKTISKWHNGKWLKYIEFAVIRFFIWKECLKPGSKNVDYCPPLDVLMVWHSLLLNPVLLHMHFTEDPIINVKFPWERFHNHLNNKTWDFSLSSREKQDFIKNTAMRLHLFTIFKDWPVQTTAVKEKTYIGLHDFSFGKSPAEKLSHLLPKGEKAKSIQLYSMAFRHVPVHIAEELRDAVKRQFAFVEKMHDHLWIRSPGLEGTLERAINRYDEFLELMKREPGTMLVPTLDIDLVWHTHQCTASQYAEDMKARVGRFINHDDKIAAVELSSGFDRTAGLYMKHFGKNYSICGCWECELLTSKMGQVVISGEEIDMDRVVQEIKDEMLYYRAVEVKRREKKPLPIR